ncbi:MAG: penicillin-binding protein 2 [Leptolyngbyaceae cyanobacterium SM2_3_12]|nr:penicillin-binding protein 2 [Leptolyngbyaceae cyanobacterium SM2_3_12]
MASSSISARLRRRKRSQRLITDHPVVQPSSQRRVILVWLLLILAMVGLGGRLVWLQLVQGATLGKLAQSQHIQPSPTQPLRYPIVDRQGNVLAVDRVVYTLYAHPKLFKQTPAEVAEALAPILEQPPEALLGSLSQQPSGIRLTAALTEEEAQHIRTLRLDGLELVAQQQRFYPQQELFAPIVGFVNLEGKAQAGLEISEQDRLLLPAPAKVTPAAPSPLPQTRASLRLTLDSRLQRVAQQELEAVVVRHQAKRGTVMVMEANTGAILAMATVPTYDPNRYYEADISAFRNWAISDLYEPGSTFKPINVAIALENGAITPDEMVNDSGKMQFGEWPIQNHDYKTVGGRGPISITQVLEYSSNVGMVRIMQKLSAATFFDWLQRLGLDQTTGIDLPAEAAGHMKNRDQFIRSKVELATTSFGQGFSLTPIKMLQMEATLANGGKLVTPHVVSGLINEDGTSQWVPHRPAPRSIFSAQTSEQVLGMMEAVVAEGTGQPAYLPGYRIGGKTGTAQKATLTGGYGQGRITSFVGILPVQAPRYVVLAVIDEPVGDNAYGSTVAAPLVKQVIEALVVLEGLPPTDSEPGP